MTGDIAIAHKDYDVRGGGEIVAEELARVFDAPLYVGRRDEDKEAGADLEQPIAEIDYSPLPPWLARRLIDRGGVTRSATYQFVWQQQTALEGYDVVVTSGNEPLWYVPRDHQTIVAYTHTPPRWQYDLFGDQQGLLHVAYNYCSRVLYQHNVPRVDRWIANSDLVARRIGLYWGIADDAIDVVYPPVPTEDFDPGAAPTGEHYLHLGRLADHKHVEELVRAFERVDAQLKIAGDGPERDRLERMAPSNVEFLGYVAEARKPELMAAAKAHLYPARNEDFGMVPVESLAAGTPVIGVDEGFTRYQIKHGANGLLYDRGVEGLVEAIREFEREGVLLTEAELHDFAGEHFGRDRFASQMRDAVDRAQDATAIDTPWGGTES